MGRAQLGGDWRARAARNCGRRGRRARPVVRPTSLAAENSRVAQLERRVRYAGRRRRRRDDGGGGQRPAAALTLGESPRGDGGDGLARVRRGRPYRFVISEWQEVGNFIPTSGVRQPQAEQAAASRSPRRRRPASCYSSGAASSPRSSRLAPHLP